MNVEVRQTVAQSGPRWQWGQDRLAEMLNVAAGIGQLATALQDSS
jgi:hypothetical protein